MLSSEAAARKVRGAARKLLTHVEDKLVLDWKKRQQTRSAVRVAIGEVLDEELPEVYGPELYDAKVGSVFDHIYTSNFDDGGSVYDESESEARSDTAVATLPDVAEDVSDELVAMAAANPDLRARLMEKLLGTDATWACSTKALLGGETREVEYKQTARWNVREGREDRAMEDVIVKTVAGMLNDHGGTLLIGVTDDGEPVGLDDDYALVKPPNADGFVNWLDTLFDNSLGHAGASRLLIRMDQVDSHDVCRIDIPASSRPIWVKNPNGTDTLYQRRNDSTRAVPTAELDTFLTDRFGPR